MYFSFSRSIFFLILRTLPVKLLVNELGLLLEVGRTLLGTGSTTVLLLLLLLVVDAAVFPISNIDGKVGDNIDNGISSLSSLRAPLEEGVGILRFLKEAGREGDNGCGSKPYSWYDRTISSKFHETVCRLVTAIEGASDGVFRGVI